MINLLYFLLREFKKSIIYRCFELKFIIPTCKLKIYCLFFSTLISFKKNVLILNFVIKFFQKIFSCFVYIQICC